MFDVDVLVGVRKPFAPWYTRVLEGLLTSGEERVAADELEEGDQSECDSTSEDEHPNEYVGCRDSSSAEVVQDHEQCCTTEGKHSTISQMGSSMDSSEVR